MTVKVEAQKFLCTNYFGLSEESADFLCSNFTKYMNP